MNFVYEAKFKPTRQEIEIERKVSNTHCTDIYTFDLGTHVTLL